jgi:hypothetical protein
MSLLSSFNRPGPASFYRNVPWDRYVAEYHTESRKPLSNRRNNPLRGPPPLAMSSQPVTHLYRSLLRELRLAVSPGHAYHTLPYSTDPLLLSNLRLVEAATGHTQHDGDQPRPGVGQRRAVR